MKYAIITPEITPNIHSGKEMLMKSFPKSKYVNMGDSSIPAISLASGLAIGFFCFLRLLISLHQLRKFF